MASALLKTAPLIAGVFPGVVGVMGERRGWVKFPRAVIEDPLLNKDNDYLVLWIHLLTAAAHEPTPALLGGKRIMLQPGQLTTGLLQLSARSRIEKHKVDRILKKLESEKLIEQKTTNKNRMITILTSDFADFAGGQSEKPVRNGRETSEKPVRTLEELKNKRTEEYICSFSHEFYSFWEAYPRKVCKPEAYKVFVEVMKSGCVSIDKILEALSWQAPRFAEQDEQFVPHPATWLNQGRWEDEMPGSAMSAPLERPKPVRYRLDENGDLCVVED